MDSEQRNIRAASLLLFATWLVHDVEEALTFPATSRILAERFDTTRILVTPAQSGIAIALVGILVAKACARGASSNGESRLFRAVLAGLEAHVISHVVASLLLRRYTAGVVTAVLVMLPGARVARAALRRVGAPVAPRDIRRGAALMISAAAAAHLVARRVCPSPRL